MMVELGCVVLGGLAGTAVTVFVFHRKRWPRMIREVEQQVERRVKQKILLRHAKAVRPVVDQVVSRIQGIIAIMEEAVLELMARVQDITSAAIQETNQAARDLGNETGKRPDDTLLVDETNNIIETFSASEVQSTQVGMDVTMVVGEVQASTQRITPLLEEIEFIADQTRLLALNAAIEAARAKEHGRGFAIVAEEVAKLANRSRNAAANIQTVVSEANASTEKAMTSLQGVVSIDLTEILKTREQIRDITKILETKSSKLEASVLLATSSVQKYASQVSNIVMSMNFHDIFRQRLEQAIQDLTGLREEVQKWSELREGERVRST